MNILTQTEQEGATIIHLNGSLGQSEVAQVQRQFRAVTTQEGAAVVVDLSGVEYVATTAIAMLLEGAQILRRSGGRLVLARPQSRIAEILRRLRLERVLPMFDTLDEGLQQVRPSAPSA